MSINGGKNAAGKNGELQTITPRGRSAGVVFWWSMSGFLRVSVCEWQQLALRGNNVTTVAGLDAIL
jgi:hypothetical protein